MTDPVTLKEALRRTGLAEFMLLEDTLPAHVETVRNAAREYLAFLEGPTDEDVEIAAKAIYEGGLTDEHPKWADQPAEAKGWYRASARAGLMAVAEARRQR